MQVPSLNVDFSSATPIFATESVNFFEDPMGKKLSIIRTIII